MKYRKIFKWELFAGFAIIFIVIFFLVNLLITAIFKNILDDEADKWLDVTGDTVINAIDPFVFSLRPGDSGTAVYAEYMKTMNALKNKRGMDITFLTPEKKLCITTEKETGLIDAYLLNDIRSYNITVFEKGIPIKHFAKSYIKNGVFYGFILLKSEISSFKKIFVPLYTVFLIILAVALAISFVFSFMVTRRIDKTVNSMEMISSGDPDRYIEVQWIDEISFLQDQINKMIRNLRELEDSRTKEIQIVAMGMAHEIKNPAGAIFNLAELAEKVELPKESLDRISRIKSEVIRLNDIVDKFIHFAKEKIIDKDPCRLEDFINLLLDQYPKIELNYGSTDSGKKVLIDKLLLERAFKNLIRNAYESGSMVNITVSSTNKSDIFEITDNGALIPPDIADKIFIPFFTTKPAGMGIGLAITKNIIEKHGGTIKYLNKEGQNCFRIEIPGL